MTNIELFNLLNIDGEFRKKFIYKLSDIVSQNYLNIEREPWRISNFVGRKIVFSKITGIIPKEDILTEEYYDDVVVIKVGYLVGTDIDCIFKITEDEIFVTTFLMSGIGEYTYIKKEEILQLAQSILRELKIDNIIN